VSVTGPVYVRDNKHPRPFDLVVPKHIGVIRWLFAKKKERSDLYGDIDPAANDNHAISLALANGHIKVDKSLLAKKEERPDLYGEIILE
jgi:hypothetical protein